MYTIIGDDIAIFDKTVASKYLMVMDSLGIEINHNKSVVSERQPFCGEIAKRLFIRGKEISPIPPDIIRAASKDWKVFPQLVSIMQDFGWLDCPKEQPNRSLEQLTDRICPLLDKLHSKRSEDLFDILTYPLQKKPYIIDTGVDSVWNKYSLEILELISKRHASAILEKKIRRLGPA
jgi:hypothetical protein